MKSASFFTRWAQRCGLEGNPELAETMRRQASRKRRLERAKKAREEKEAR